MDAEVFMIDALWCRYGMNNFRKSESFDRVWPKMCFFKKLYSNSSCSLEIELSWVFFQIWPMTLDLWLDLRDSIQLIFSKLHGCARVRLQMTFRRETPRQFTWRQGVLEFKMFKFSVIPGFGHIVSLLANIFHLACYCPVVQTCALISICERNSFSRVMTKRSLRASSRISKRPISVEELHRSSRVNTYLHDILTYIDIYIHIMCIYIHIYVSIVCFDMIVNIMASHFSR